MNLLNVFLDIPPNLHLNKDVLKTSFAFVFRRRYQDVLIKTNIFTLVIRLQKTSSRRFKTSWSRPIYSFWPYVFKTSSKTVFKTSSRRLQNVFKASCKNVFKTSSRHLQDVFETFCKTFSRRIIKLNFLTSLRNVLNKFLRRTAKMVICRRICLGHASEKFMVSVQNLQE